VRCHFCFADLKVFVLDEWDEEGGLRREEPLSPSWLHRGCRDKVRTF
jgi:hypothetical protein